MPNPKGTPYVMPGALSPEQVKALIPKDILMFNWFWDTRREEGLESGLGERNEAMLSEWGFQQVFGNFRPDFQDFDRRAARRGILGGAPSSWAATNELNFGKDLMWEFLGCANLLWSTDRPDLATLSTRIQALLPGIRRKLARGGRCRAPTARSSRWTSRAPSTGRCPSCAAASCAWAASRSGWWKGGWCATAPGQRPSART